MCSKYQHTGICTGKHGASMKLRSDQVPVYRSTLWHSNVHTSKCTSEHRSASRLKKNTRATNYMKVAATKQYHESQVVYPGTDIDNESTGTYFCAAAGYKQYCRIQGVYLGMKMTNKSTGVYFGTEMVSKHPHRNPGVHNK